MKRLRLLRSTTAGDGWPKAHLQLVGDCFVDVRHGVVDGSPRLARRLRG